MTEERLAELESLCEKATPGPWLRQMKTSNKASIAAALPDDEPSEWVDRKVPDGQPPEKVAIVSVPTWSNGKHLRKRSGRDLDFIAAARTALPELLAEVRALRTSCGREPGGRWE